MNTGTNKTRPKGIIFDLDGTLVNSFQDIATAVNLTRKEFSFDSLTFEEVKSMVGSGSVHLVRMLVPVPEDQFETAYRTYLGYYEAHILDQSQVYPGAAKALDYFSDRRLFVVTNKNHHLAELVLGGLGIRDRFTEVLGGDSLPKKKPDPLPLLTISQRSGLQPDELIMVGDGLHDIEAGKTAGVCTVAVTTGVEPREVLEKAGPDYLLDSLSELPDLFA